MFGKRNKPVEPEQLREGPGDPGGPPGGTPPGDTPFPWHGDPSWTACNLATGNLANNLPAWVEHEGRVHAETYVAASGAIAGYAAQQSLRELDPGAQLHTATIASGEKYLFGDPLNDMLFAKSNAEAAAGGRVWPRAASAAVSAGLPISDIPDVEDMFGYVTESLNGAMEGRPSTGPTHQPIAPVRQLLALYWPHAVRVFAADFDDVHRRFGPVPTRWWYAVAAYATSRPILDVKDVLRPAVSLRILMESAIYASKLTRF